MDQLKTRFNSQLQKDALFKDHTTLAIGGPTKGVIKVQTQKDLLEAIVLSQKEQIPYLVIGGGSNLLVADEGVDKLIIKNEVIGLASQGQTLQVQSGNSLQGLVDFAINQGLAGLEKLTGIPGTVGGAVYGNAGAYGQTISDSIAQVVAFDPQTQKVIVLSKEEGGFAYRHSNFKNNGLIILEAYFKLQPDDPVRLKQQSQLVLEERLKKYPPALKCPGSFFKNILATNLPSTVLELIPQEKIVYGKVPAGYLLEKVGAKGQKLGAIEVASSHANLFTNLGEGTAEDFYKLAQDLAQKVKEKYGITLEPEVQLLGLPSLS